MKKNIIILVSILLIVIVMFSVVFIFRSDGNKIDYTNDEIKFKDEYENLNGYELSEGYILKNVNIEVDNNVKYVEDDEIVDLFRNGTNVIYFGWADCNWCRSIVPVLIDVVKKENINTLYYYDLKSLRNNYENNINEEKVKIYEEIINIIGEDITSVFDDESTRKGEKKILAPTVIFIKDGEYIGLHVKSVDSHKLSIDELDEKQINELKQIYKSYINKIRNNICNEGC